MSYVKEAQREALEVLEAYLPPFSGAPVALAAEKISVSFGGVQALDDVSIEVPSRSLVGLIGPNGAGKSTLFDVVNGLRKPDHGRIDLFGRDVTNTTGWDRAKQGVSRTFQSNRVDIDLSVTENLLAGAYNMIPGGVLASILGLRRVRNGESRAREAARAVVELLDLGSAGDTPVRSLDFGSQRRVEIGRSLMSGPRLLLLDEPAAGLDAPEAAHFFALIRRLGSDLGLTVLLVEHYVKAVLENCDLIYVLDQGRLIAAGEPDEIRASAAVRAAYLGNASATEPKDDVNADA